MSSGPEAVTTATEPASRDQSSVIADTHVLIWYFTAPSMLSETAIQIMENAVAADQPIVIAAVSLIELVYITEKRPDMTSAGRAQVRDPFDRAIVATAQVLRLPLLTKDGTLTRHFPKLCVW